jgi:hypothetical protein
MSVGLRTPHMLDGLAGDRSTEQADEPRYRDCRDCFHNSYLGHPLIDDWVSCSHPATLAKGPRWEKGDPAMVNYRTGDVPLSEILNLQDCPTWTSTEPTNRDA